MNFTALLSRLSTTCLNRSSSASTSPTAASTSSASGGRGCAARSRIIESPYSSASRTENVTLSSSICPGLDLRQVEDLAEELEEVLARAPDVAEVLLLAIVDLAEHAVEQHLREPDHRVERCAQLVRHAGEELRLVAADHLQLGGLALELAEQPSVEDRQR